MKKLAKPGFVLSFALVAGVCHAAITTEVIGTFKGECTAYARSKVPSLPYGLYSFNDKLRVINSRSCKAGSVAIIDVGNSVGHVAVVESCDSSGSMQGLKVVEANWRAGQITRRSSRVSGSISKSESELRIRGYFRP
ncbi:MAG: CHAP domain-containing protein [Candidatus Competibacter sp.]|nr:CHAP domain-containing protein [Candidatus Competibacter sp.]